MPNILKTRLVIVLVSVMLLPMALAVADESTAVKISFDELAERVDIVSKTPVPDYEFAQRGSLRFYLWDINQPQDFFTYLHDGVRTVPIENMISMEKVHDPHGAWDSFAVWIISMKSGFRNSPRIRELGVSFIPLEPSASGLQPGERVYLKMSDMKEIIWE
jgi:hypothetical protein